MCIRDSALPALGYTPLPSAANFVLFGGVADPHAVFEALLERDIICLLYTSRCV